MRRMSRADRKLWHSATTLTELGELTARWLSGEIRSQPGYEPGCGPDEETTHLIPTLAACNRAGYLTCGSQPGEADWGYDGSWWQQRAAVQGFALSETAEQLALAAERAGLWVVAHHTQRRLGRFRGGRWRTPVTTADGDTVTAFGSKLDLGTVQFLYQEAGDAALAEVLDAWQLTLIDPVWERDTVLWSVLTEWAQQRATATPLLSGRVRG